MNALSFMSNIPDAAQSAQLGIARGIGGLNEDAQVVAQSVTGSGGDLTAALVDSLQQKLAVEASAKVLTASDQMLGSLIDVMA
jgi:flagellar basal body rod protein FlgG